MIAPSNSVPEKRGRSLVFQACHLELRDQRFPLDTIIMTSGYFHRTRGLIPNILITHIQQLDILVTDLVYF